MKHVLHTCQLLDEVILNISLYVYYRTDGRFSLA